VADDTNIGIQPAYQRKYLLMNARLTSRHEPVAEPRKYQESAKCVSKSTRTVGAEFGESVYPAFLYKFFPLAGAAFGDGKVNGESRFAQPLGKVQVPECRPVWPRHQVENPQQRPAFRLGQRTGA